MNESIVQLSLVTHADAYTPCICAKRIKSFGYCSLAASGILFSDYVIYVYGVQVEILIKSRHKEFREVIGRQLYPQFFAY